MQHTLKQPFVSCSSIWASRYRLSATSDCDESDLKNTYKKCHSTGPHRTASLSQKGYTIKVGHDFLRKFPFLRCFSWCYRTSSSSKSWQHKNIFCTRASPRCWRRISVATTTSKRNCPLSHTKFFSTGKEVLVAYRCILKKLFCFCHIWQQKEALKSLSQHRSALSLWGGQDLLILQ